MVDELFRYVDEQLKRGYTQAQIKDALIKSGYSPAVVDSILQRAAIKPGPYYNNPDQDQGTKNFSPSIAIAAVFVLLLISAAIAYPFLFKSKEALLDVIATPDREHYRAGENVGFDVQVINMGTKERFDVTMNYRLFDENDNMVSNKEDTIAVSTSTSQHREFKLSPSFKPGQYTMKIIANYDGKVATSSFQISVDEAKPATPGSGTCFDNMKNQDETNIDCGGTCGGYWYDNNCHETPKSASTGTIKNDSRPADTNPSGKADCSDGTRNQDEVGIDCGGVCGGYWYDLKCNAKPKNNQPISSEKPVSVGGQLLELRTLAKSSPVAAKNGCLEFDDDKIRDSCLKSVAQVAMEASFCELIYDSKERDLCYYPFFMNGDYSVCDKLTQLDTLQTCAQLKQLADLMKNPPQPAVAPEPAPVPEEPVQTPEPVPEAPVP